MNLWLSSILHDSPNARGISARGGLPPLAILGQRMYHQKEGTVLGKRIPQVRPYALPFFPPRCGCAEYIFKCYIYSVDSYIALLENLTVLTIELGGFMGILETFSTNMQHYRRQAHLTQEQLAERCGLHRTYIGGIEQLRINVSLKNVEKIADALEIEPSLLFAEEHEQPPRP